MKDSQLTVMLAVLASLPHSPPLAAHAEALRQLDATTPAGSKEAARLYTNRALALTRSQQPHAAHYASEDCTAALQADPTFAKALYRRAVARQDAGDLAGAAADCEAAQGMMAAAGEDAAEVVSLLQHLQLSLPGEQSKAAAAAAPPPDQAPAAAASNSSVIAEQDAPPAPPAASSEASSHGPAALGMHAEQQAVQAASQGLLRAGHSSISGRHLLAAADIAAGTAVLQEAPLAAVIMRSHTESRYAAAEHCQLDTLHVMHPFPRLAHVVMHEQLGMATHAWPAT